MKDRTCLERLSTSIQKKYLVLVERVERYKLTATRDTSYGCTFMKPSLNEGYTTCKQCDKLTQSRGWWNVLAVALVRGFLREVTKALKPTLAVDATGASRSAEVTDENAVRYTVLEILFENLRIAFQRKDSVRHWVHKNTVRHGCDSYHRIQLHQHHIDVYAIDWVIYAQW